MMNISAKFFIILVLSASHTIQAFIYQVQVAKKGDQVIIGCGDYHDKQHPSHYAQRAALMATLTGCNPHTTAVILEDLCTVTSAASTYCQQFFSPQKGSILGGMVQTCRSLGFPVTNVEFRHCRVASLAPVLYNMHSNEQSLSNTATINMVDLVQEINQMRTQVQTYDDGPVLNTWCSDTLRAIERDCTNFGLERSMTESVADYIQRMKSLNDKALLLNALLTFDSDLLDINIVHYIVNAQAKHKIFVFAGGAHINRVIEQLEKVGYQKVYATDVSTEKEFNDRKCVGSGSEGNGYCVRPKPLNASVLSSILSKY